MASRKFGISKQTLHTWRKEREGSTEKAGPGTQKPVHEKARNDQQVIDSLIEKKRYRKDLVTIVSEPRRTFPFDELLSHGGMARSTYYYQLGLLKQQDKYHELEQQIRAIRRSPNGLYGYRRMHLEHPR